MCEVSNSNTFNVYTNREIYVCMVLIFSFSNVMHPPVVHASFTVMMQSGSGRSNGTQLLFDKRTLGESFPSVTTYP